MYIFLDIDGVLNCKKQWSKNYALDDSCIEHFCEFASATGGKIILATSWRKAWAGRNNPSNPPHIKQLEAKLGRHGCKIYGKTISVDGRRRDEEIKAFLEAHPGEHYIIIDDDSSEYSGQIQNLYIVNPENGFTKKDAEKAWKIVRKVIG